MNMYIRIFYGGYYKDISLQNIQVYSIGSRTDNGFEVTNSDMEAEHIKLINENGSWSIVCMGEVYLNGKQIKNEKLSPSQLYILSVKNRISMLVLEECLTPIETVDLNGTGEITIGRNKSNHIVFDSALVSGNHAVIEKNSSGVHITDKNSSNGTYVNGKSIKDCVLKEHDEIVISDFKMVYKDHKVYIYGGKDGVTVHMSQKKDFDIKGEVVNFKRSPRLKLEIPTGDIEVQSPPSIGSKPEISWLSVILPSCGTVGASLVITLLTGMSPMMLAFTAPMAIIGIVISITNYHRQKKKHSIQENLRLEKYSEHLKNVIEEIEDKQDAQRVAMISANPETNECINIVKSVQKSLWSRRPSDSDFMTFRVGSGTVDFSVNIKIPRTTISLVEDELLNKTKEIYNKYTSIDGLPIMCSLLSNITCGIVGKSKDTVNLVNNILIQIATHHSYTEVKTVIIYDDKDMPELDWTIGLPHSYDNEKNGCYIAHNKKEAQRLFSNLEDAFKERVQDGEEEHYEKSLKIPYYVFIVADLHLIEDETICKYLYKNDSTLGLGSIFLCKPNEVVPKDCNVIVEVNNLKGEIYNKDRASQKKEFYIDKVSMSDIVSFGNKIKKIRCEEMNGEVTIANKISLFQVLNIKSVEELNIRQRWDSSNVIKSIVAPLGVKEKNELVYLDLHENAQGPHGLVAGATGYGKSEVIQSYLLALATLYHPYEVGFVIIDFKGGGMSKQFEKLPHLIGSITDMDGKEIERSKQSIKAELDKRKRLFAENKVNKIDDYIELYKQNKVDTPIPHLIIIVDEFAELRAEQPDFMDDLTSTARIGRSLGVHLILATQNPSGQINEQIQSNAKFGICLSVRDKSASQEVIKSSLASKITDKGRAYLRVFEGNTLELFQSGFSGTEVTLSDGTVVTELKCIVEYLNRYCNENSIKKLSPICLPSLKEKIYIDENEIIANIKNTKIPIGLFDSPSTQEQGVAYINVGQNLFVLGSAQTGKTNLLQSVIKNLSLKYSPTEVNIYIMDFGSGVLKSFEELNHVGGVVLSDEDEKLKNLFKLLNTEIEQRKKRTIEVGVSSFSAYLESGYTDMPRIILILDNYSKYREDYDEEFDQVFIRICREGITYGVSVIVTSPQSVGFRHSFLPSFSERIVFTCNDTNEYSSMFDKCRTEPTNYAGRALCQIGNSLLETQTFIAFEGEIESERTRALKEYIRRANEKYKNQYAKPIPYIPNMLTMSYILENYDLKMKSYEYVQGLDYSTIDIVTTDFNKTSEFAIVGNNQEKKKYEVSNIMNRISETLIDAPVRIFIIDAIERPLKKYSEFSATEKYTVDYSEIDAILDEISDEVSKRYTVLINESIEALEKYPLIVILINNRETVDYISSTKEVMEKYRNIQKQIKALKITFIYSDVENTNVSFGAPEILKRLRDGKKAVITDDLKETLFFDITPNVVRNAKPLQERDIFYISGNDVKRVKLIEEG